MRFSIKSFAEKANDLYYSLQEGASYDVLWQKADRLEKMICDNNGRITIWIRSEWYNRVVEDFTFHFVKTSVVETVAVKFLEKHHKKFLLWFGRDFRHLDEDRVKYLLQVISLYEKAMKKIKDPKQKKWFEIRIRNFTKRLIKSKRRLGYLQ